MPRYDLDKLGWFEFERLCFVLLKAHLGLGVEAWGGTKDWGRDAYYEGALPYPNKERQKGPFLFQCKFVNGANAADADPSGSVLQSVQKECKAINAKMSGRSNPLRGGRWPEAPAVYTLMTNAPLRPEIREKIKTRIKDVLPDSQVITWGGDDICSMIDLASGIAKKFPQILGLNDLMTLLEECVNKDILTRSEAAIEEAKSISQVFVPTQTYNDTLRVLREHHYVVLEGPPEVGKTAIGRMIGLTFLVEGWDVYECSGPKDILKVYQRDRKQVFIADDFFGRTDYRPERVNDWQDELPAVLRIISRTHLLILTSRKHLLEMAKAKLDVPGDCPFPSPAEVLVDVSELSEIEKALMLYKHFKNARVSDVARVFVRSHARYIVRDAGFTPERIRYLTDEVSRLQDGSAADRMPNLVKEVLTNPTERMGKTYDALPVPYKWLMISLLAAEKHSLSPHRTRTDGVKEIYERLCPPSELHDFDTMLRQLSETFLKTIRLKCGSLKINWLHPSCGDMVAEKLSNDPRSRLHFLQNCDIDGLKFAVSVGGGAKGLAALPLLRGEKDWEVFEAQLVTLLGQDYSVVRVIVDAIAHLSSRTDLRARKEKLERLAENNIIPVFIQNCNTHGWKPAGLKMIYELMEKRNKIDWPHPKCKSFWLASARHIIDYLRDGESFREITDDVEEFSTLTKTIKQYDGEFFSDNDVADIWEQVLAVLVESGKRECDDVYVGEDIPDLEEMVSYLEEAKEIFSQLAWCATGNEELEISPSEIAMDFECIYDEAVAYLPPEPDYDAYQDDLLFDEHSCQTSVEQIFRDL